MLLLTPLVPQIVLLLVLKTFALQTSSRLETALSKMVVLTHGTPRMLSTILVCALHLAQWAGLA